MYYEKHRGGLSERFRATAVLLLAVLVIMFVNSQFRRVLSATAEINAQNQFSAAVSNAVMNVINDGCSFEVVTLSTDANGNIVSVQSDAGKANRLKAQITESLLSQLNSADAQSMIMTLGTLSGIEIMAGRGPTVDVRLELRNGISTEIISEFSEAGINQTLHRMSCVVTADYSIILPGHSFSATLSSTVLLSESLIVGVVPGNYTYVVGDQSDTIGRIFDYGTGQDSGY